MAGSTLARRLGLNEYQRLTFAPDAAEAAGPGDMRVDYDSPLVERLGALVDGLGRAAVLRGPDVR